MANAQIQRKLSQISSELGYELPVICTPYELMGYEVSEEWVVYENKILEEIRAYREEYARSFNYDLEAIVDDLRQKQAASGRKFVKLPIKRNNKRLVHTSS